MIAAVLARFHLKRHRSRLEAGDRLHVAVCPPVDRGAASTNGLWRWLRAGWRDSSLTVQPRPSRAPAGVAPLWAVRLEFMRALHGIQTQPASHLLDRIGRARSLRDLWHLRPDLFELVAHHRDQAEAHARLARLNRHFPTRAPASGFGALGPALSRTKVVA
jgi:hypothetical protein